MQVYVGIPKLERKSSVKYVTVQVTSESSEQLLPFIQKGVVQVPAQIKRIFKLKNNHQHQQQQRVTVIN